MRLFFLTILFFCLFSSNLCAQENSILLKVKPIAKSSDPLLVIGQINAPYFSIKNIHQAALYDADGKWILLEIEKSSLYSEFNDNVINSMRIKFFLSKKSYEKGNLRFVWGNEIFVNNIEIEKIEIDKEQYQTFEQLKPSDIDKNPAYSSTVEVIVDDQADKYYLWYLAPIIFIFGLLLVRRFFFNAKP